MNYPTFLQEVDRLASGCDADSLRLFVHEMARTVPEADRTRFLSTLNGFCGASDAAFKDNPKTDTGLADQIDSILKTLEGIRSGKRALESEYNEEWDEWDEDDEDEFVFTDPDHILNDIAAAAAALHQSLDQEEYGKGAELAKILSELTVHVSGDCEDEELGMTELVAYDLLDIDMEQTVKEALYLTCMGCVTQDRAEEMLTIMDQFGVFSVSLDEILQTGSDEIMLDSLLPSWIEALAKRPAAKTDQLLIEAQSMLQDPKTVLENASRYAGNHPVLYQTILQTGLANADLKEMTRIGLRAIKEIPAQHPTRSKVSLLTAKYALAAQERQIAETCWMEAFRTAPTVANYLRLRLRARRWEDYADGVRIAYTSYYSSRHSWEQKPLAALMFFEGRFGEMLGRFMKPGTGIGWSDTFMKEGIALILLLLDSGKTDRQGISAMWELAIHACSFDSEEYCEGTELANEGSTEALFRKCFRDWKATVDLPEGASEAWLQKIAQWIELRVSAIMDANRRNYYGECAAFIAAFGEVLESVGKPGEKLRIMQQYRTRYSRRRAFHEALRSFGMSS